MFKNRLSLSVLVSLAGALLAPGAAHAGAIVGAESALPATAYVGATNVPASVTLTNGNSSPDTTLTLCNVGDVAGCDGTEGITLVPSCGGLDFTASCMSPDPGVFNVRSPAFGAAGSACDGMQFTTSIINTTSGKVRFTPTGGQHVVLPAPGAFCRILFTADVLSFPDIDAQVATPGLQTIQIVEALGFSNRGLLTFGRGSSAGVTVKGAPTIAASASPGITVGGQVSATSTLTGEYNPSAGSVTFSLYGPGDTTCAGPAVFTSPVTINADGTATSGSFTPTSAGTYRWVAAYAGDANNDPATSQCSAGGAAISVARIAPTMTATASPGVVIGGQVTASTSLVGEHNPTSGNVTFKLYGPGDASCAQTAAFTSTVAVAADGTATAAQFTPLTAGTYRWVAQYAGDDNNQSSATSCNDAGTSVVIAKKSPTMTSNASAGGTIGVQLTDSVTLTGEHNPTNGSVTFKLYGPDDAGCSGSVAFQSTVAIASDGTATSPAFAPTAPGTYRWGATYGGDANNEPAVAACNDTGTSTTVSKATPSLTATASAGVTVGGSITDAVVLSGEYNPAAGTVLFKLYGPNDASCASAAVLSQSVPINAGGTATSPAYVTSAPGVYRWVASYSGDANNAAAAGACGDAGQSVTVAQAAPVIAVNASAGVAVGGSITSASALTGEFHPTTGTVTFKLYGPGDATCSGAHVFQSTVAVSAAGAAGSQPFSPSAPGTYRWVASYGGDANNAAAAVSCNAPGSTVTVTTATPTLTTNASPAVPVGGTISDSATLQGEFGPTSGTVTFTLYGPDDATCSGAPVLQSVVAINADGSATSAPFTANVAGLYRWVASYSGDAANAPAGAACNDANESVPVGKARPTVVSVPTPPAKVGDSVKHSISLAGEHGPVSGSVTFNLFGNGDATCSGAPVFSSTVRVNPDGTATSPAFAPAAAGTYRWIASYSGDGANAPATGACNDANASLTVTVPASPLLCGSTKIALVDVFPEGRRTIISGVAQPTFAGKLASIALKSTGKTVVQARIGANGTFATSTALPAASLRARARYLATVDSSKSAALKLQRRMYMTRAALRGNKLSFAGKVVGRFKSGATVTLQQIVLCTQKTAVASAKLSRKGTFQITLPAQANAMSLLYRAKTTVLNDNGKREATFTLPRPISLSAAR